MKKGLRIVHGDKELIEKLGRNDLCPCDSKRRFQKLLSPKRQIRRFAPRLLFLGNKKKRIQILECAFLLKTNPIGWFLVMRKRNARFRLEKRRAHLQRALRHQAGEMRLVGALREMRENDVARRAVEFVC